MATVRLHPHIKTTPRPAQYLIALVSLIFAVALFAGIYVLFELNARSALRENLTSRILTGNTRTDVREALAWISTPSLLTTEILGIDRNVQENKTYRANLLLKALDELHNGNVQKAYSLSTDQLSAELKQSYRDYFEKEKKATSLKSKIEQKHREVEIAEKQFELIAQDISDLFASKSLVRDANDNILRYQSGVMKDMPAIKGLPDRLMELEDLKPYIKLIVGVMNNDQVQEFRANFERFQAVSRKNAAEIGSLKAQATSLEQKSRALSVELSDLTARLIALSTQEITDI